LTRRWRKERRDAQERPLEEEAAVDPEMHLRRLALKQAVAAMQPGDRLLTLLWLEGLTALEIEQVTGVKAATVAVRLSRIRRNLRPSRSET
jgi:DNA-directed RNA polymerase specialized sigma24 family protein